MNDVARHARKIESSELIGLEFRRNGTETQEIVELLIGADGEDA